jgi:phage terminase large subunit
MLVKEIDFFRDIFDAYPQQKEFMAAVFSGLYDMFIENAHRRFGKDAEFFNCAWLYAATIPGNHLYTLPKIGQARNVIWEGTDLDGVKWKDKIPLHLIAGKSEVECKLRFINGSILHITGADNILNAHLGSNLRSVWMSEFHRTHPQIWDYLRPILKRSKGIAAFNYTSFGKGHAYRLMMANKDRPRCFARKLTVDDTRDNQGNYIFTPEQIQEERDSGMDEDLIQQEYYCDDNVAVKGTYFGDQLALAHKENRIVKGLVIDKNVPVHTSWDLGSRDTNSIWFFQVIGVGAKARFLYFYQHDKNYGDIEYYLKLLAEVKNRFGFVSYGKHFMPHDISQVEYTSGKTRRVVFMQNKISPHPVPMVRVIERVQITRSMFKQCWFDADNCKIGLEALSVSRANYNESLRAFSADEVHDWASHASAAFQYGHVGWMEHFNQPMFNKQREYSRSKIATHKDPVLEKHPSKMMTNINRIRK